MADIYITTDESGEGFWVVLSDAWTTTFFITREEAEEMVEAEQDLTCDIGGVTISFGPQETETLVRRLRQFLSDLKQSDDRGDVIPPHYSS